MAPENGPLVGRIILRDLGPLVSRQTKEADLVVEPEGLCFTFLYSVPISGNIIIRYSGEGICTCWRVARNLKL